MNILFLCTANLNRSKTAELYCEKKYPQHNFKSAGLSERYCKINSTTLCTENLLQWADSVFVMEEMHIERISEHTGDKYLEKLASFDIEDKFKLNHPVLLERLEQSFAKFPDIFRP